MSRLLLLLIFALWLGGSPVPQPPAWDVWISLAVFLGGFAALVAVVAVWARRLARRIAGIDVHRSLRRFNRVLTLARTAIPVWLAVGIFGPPGWAYLVHQQLDPVSMLAFSASDGPVRLALPALLVGTLPAILAWMGLWWAQFPAERALREQTLLDQLERDLPVHAPPGLRSYLAGNFRLQILFIYLPILLILAIHDAALLAFRFAGLGIGGRATFENWVILPAGALVFLFAPEILRRVLHTRPLPASPLRSRLEGICRRIGLRYRDILLWHTEYSMGNAAVMGIVPRMRYILLSDLLLETMTDQQIEAVFAHEVGHIVHRHMPWYVVFFIVLFLAALGPGYYVENWIADAWSHLGIRNDPYHVGEILGAIGAFAWVFVLFGYLSRRFERQADVFAARMIETNWGEGRPAVEGASALEASSPAAPPEQTHVGEYGAGVFASALHRVALINNIPVSARSWCHGSIGRRMRYLQEMSASPLLTARFDRLMARLYLLLLLALVACGLVALAAIAEPWSAQHVAGAASAR